MGFPTDPISSALAALQAYNQSQQPSQSTADATPDGARDAMAPFLAYQQYDPSAPNFQPPPYTSDTVNDIQMPEEPGHQVSHLPPGTAKSVPVMSNQEAAYRNGDAPTGVADATYQENRSMDDAQAAAVDASRKKQAADADTQNRLGDAYGKAYQDQANADQDYQTARQFAHQQADLETNQWMQDMQDQAVKEPNPARWFDNKSTFGKAMWALSLVSGAFSTGLSGGQLHNVALETAQKAIQSDMDEQKQRLDREMGVLKTKGQVLNQRQLRNLTDLGDDHTRALGRLNALQQEYVARAAAPGQVQNQAADAAVNSFFAQAKQGIATKRREEAVRSREEQLSRSQALRIASMTDSRERAIAAAHDQVQLDIAGMTTDRALAGEKLKASAELHKEETRISPQSGIRVLDSKTNQPVGDGSLYVSNHLKPDEVASTIEGANQMTADLATLHKAIEDDSTGSLVAKTAIDAQQALNRIQLAKANGKLSRLSDKDMDVFTGAVTGLGSSTMLDRARMGIYKDQVLAAIERAQAGVKPETENKLAALAPEGTYIDYSPKNVRPPTEQAPSPDSQIAALGGTVAPKKVPSNPDELRKYRDKGEDPNLTTSAGAGQYKPVVDKLEADIQGATPDHIKKLAAAALAAVHPDPWDQKPGSVFAEKALIPADVEDALKVAQSNETRLVDYLADETRGDPLYRTYSNGERRQLTPAHVKEVAATEFHLTNGVTPDYIEELMKAVDAKLKAQAN